MDLEQQLKNLKQDADETILRDVSFDSKLRASVLKRIQQKQGKQVSWKFITSCTAAILLVLLFVSRMGTFPEEVVQQSASHNEWSPAVEHTGVSEGKTFRYLGERPVRILTTDLYEKQGQKAVWLLDTNVGEEVVIIGKNQKGEEINVGRYTVGGPLFDAAAHFPSSVVLSAGIWKLEVQSNQGLLGTITVQVHEGIAPYNQWVEGKVIDYLQTDQELDWIGTPRYASVQLAGVESPTAETKIVYAWAVVESYDQKGEEIVRRAGWSVPAKLVIEYVGSDYRVTSLEVPPDGKDYAKGMKVLFPPAIQQKLSVDVKQAEQLSERNRQKAVTYYSKVIK